MRLPRPSPLPPAPPSGALANLVVLLVFFFLLTTSFGLDQIPVEVPAAPALHEAPPGAACLILERHVRAGEGESLTWRFSDGRHEPQTIPGTEGLFFEVSRIVDDDPERVFLLRIDGDVRYAVVDDVLESLRKAVARNVVFAARAGDGSGT